MPNDVSIAVLPDDSPLKPALVPVSTPIVEPLLGFDNFVQLTGLHLPLQAALKRWMVEHQQDPSGHYSFMHWQSHLQQTLIHQ